jgi:opacity protein-like surface antigen
MKLPVGPRKSGLSALLGLALATAAPIAAAQVPPPSTETAPPLIRPYALLKPTMVVAGSALESFSQPNASAATAAGNPVLAARRDEAQLTMQVAQSRLGVWFGEGAPVRGQFELDFFDATKASPTVQALARLRIAKVEWALSPSTLLVAGQDWDLYAPVNVHTLNLVANAFQAGNSGFMRPQAKLIWHDERLELGGALGLAAANAGAKSLLPEYNPLPTLAARAALLLGPTGRVGVSLLATRWRFSPGAAAERKAFAGGASLYGDLTPLQRLNLKLEAYVGQNLANLGTLALGTGNAVNDIQEVGGFVSAKYGLTDAHALYGLVGMAKALNSEDVVPSYGYPGVDLAMLPTPLPAESAAVLTAGAGAGFTQNLTFRLGYEYRHDKSIALMAEGFAFQTQHVLIPQLDAELPSSRTALGGELGLMFTL